MDIQQKYSSDPRSCDESQELMHYISRPGVTKEEVTEVYQKWADHYDQTIGNILWNAPKYGTEETISILGKRKDARILDAAAGTGLAGILLKNQGYTNIDALDASPKMLVKSKETGAYTNFIEAYMGPDKLNIQEGITIISQRFCCCKVTKNLIEPFVPIDNDITIVKHIKDTYDVVMTVGSFVPGHVKEDCYEELIRITKPGGYIIIVMCERYFRENPSYTGNIEPRMLALQDHGIWTRIKRQQVPNYHENYDGIIFVLQTTEDKNDKLSKLK